LTVPASGVSLIIGCSAEAVTTSLFLSWVISPILAPV
jgi:hypothetical protein